MTETLESSAESLSVSRSRAASPPSKGILAAASRMHKAVLYDASRFAVRRPILGATLTLSILLFFTIVGFVAFPLSINTIASDFTPRSSEIGRLSETRILAEENTRFNPYRDPGDLSNVLVPQQTAREYDLTVLYDVGRRRNILTETYLDAIHQVEEDIIALANFENVCLRARGSEDCLRPNGLSNYLYAEPVAGCPGVFLPNGQSAALSQPINETLLALIDADRDGVFCYTNSTNCTAGCIAPSPTYLDLSVGLGFGYPDNNVSLTPVLESDVSKSEFYFGLPLPGFNSTDDRYDAQIAKIEAFVRQCRDKVIDPANGRNGMAVLGIADVIQSDHIDEIFLRDASLVGVAIFIVGVYASWYLGSLFLAWMGMLHIVLSFPVAYLFSQMFMDYGGLGLLNMMSLFVILGIGADDVFIWCDTWKRSALTVAAKGYERPLYPAQSKAEELQEVNMQWLERRMRWSWRHAAEAMLITSLTTGVAFVMNMTSDIVAIQIFGAFTGLMILVNYLSVITYYPMIVMIYQKYIQHWAYPCCRSGVRGGCRTPASEPPLEGDGVELKPPTSGDEVEVDGAGRAVEVVKPPRFRPIPPADFGSGSGGRNVAGYRPVERFFYNRFGPAVFRFRFIVLVVFIIFAIVAIIFAAQLGPSNEPTQWLPDGDKLQESFDILADRFARLPSVPQIHIMYGLLPISFSGVNMFNMESVANSRFDNDFDPSSEYAQERFITLCELYRAQPYVLNNEVLCPMEEFRDYVQDDLGLPFPVPQADFVELLGNFTRQYEATSGPAPDYSGATPSTKQEPADRDARATAPANIYQTIRFDLAAATPDLRYMTIVVNTTMAFGVTGDQIRPMYEHFGSLLSEENKRPANINATLDGGLQTASLYVDMQLEETLLQSAVVGIGASLALAFVVLALLTQDLSLTALALTSIGGVVASLIAAVVWLGWSLSMIESIALTILVGLSVDYAVHLSHAFQDSKAPTRELKVREALLNMGPSVFSASITTLLCAAVLLGTYIVFFFKFGVFLFLATLLSALWAFFFFMALAGTLGRIRPHNDLLWFWRFITSPCRSHAARAEAKQHRPTMSSQVA